MRPLLLHMLMNISMRSTILHLSFASWSIRSTHPIHVPEESRLWISVVLREAASWLFNEKQFHRACEVRLDGMFAQRIC